MERGAGETGANAKLTLCSCAFPCVLSSFCAAVGRVGAILGNLMFGELMGTASQVMPLFITSAALLLAAISGALLPETKNLNMA